MHRFVVIFLFYCVFIRVNRHLNELRLAATNESDKGKGTNKIENETNVEEALRSTPTDHEKEIEECTAAQQSLLLHVRALSSLLSLVMMEGMLTKAVCSVRSLLSCVLQMQYEVYYCFSSYYLYVFYIFQSLM